MELFIFFNWKTQVTSFPKDLLGNYEQILKPYPSWGGKKKPNSGMNEDIVSKFHKKQ